MSDRRSASPKPRDRDRDPERAEPSRKKQKTGGFKWKEKAPRNDDESSNRDRDSGRLERGYRDRSPRRDSYRDREPRRDNYHARDDDRNGGGSDRRPREGSPRRERPRSENYDAAAAPTKAASGPSDGSAPVKEKTKKPKKPKVVAPSEPMIIVNINDRLGTKAQIPCLASDSIKAFKAVVAAHIGRQPHEIMLKRQGERPFKDQLTLEDYGVSNGVQLDLEIDTGD